MNLEEINPLSPLAKELNENILNTSLTVFDLLSKKGKRVFFPSLGIIAQAAEASEKAKPEFNATAGIATNENGPMVFPSIEKYFNHLNKKEIFNYSPSYGNRALRDLWKERLIEINPSLKGKLFSLPVVASGLTNSLSTVVDLFFNPGDTVVIPDQFWGNYKLMLDPLREIKIRNFSFFANNQFNLYGFKKVVSELADQDQMVRIILNFPNNPTGYSPTIKEQKEIVSCLKEVAKQGKKILVVLDEAYHNMFYEEGLMGESFFSKLVDLDKNIFTVKICGATKELFVWGFRIGFITYGIKGGNQDLYDALEKKTGGIIRANISNVSTPAQSILVKILKDKSYLTDFQRNKQVLKERYLEVKRVLSDKKYHKVFTPYPFNSGYFMLIRLNEKITSEEMRKKLLSQAKIGTISTGKYDLRVAFSCLNKKNILTIFEKIYEIGKKSL